MTHSDRLVNWIDDYPWHLYIIAPKYSIVITFLLSDGKLFCLLTTLNRILSQSPRAYRFMSTTATPLSTTENSSSAALLSDIKSQRVLSRRGLCYKSPAAGKTMLEYAKVELFQASIQIQVGGSFVKTPSVSSHNRFGPLAKDDPGASKTSTSPTQRTILALLKAWKKSIFGHLIMFHHLPSGNCGPILACLAYYYIHMCVCVRINIHTYLPTYLPTYPPTYVCMNIWICIYIYIFNFIYLYRCVSVYIHMVAHTVFISDHLRRPSGSRTLLCKSGYCGCGCYALHRFKPEMFRRVDIFRYFFGASGFFRCYN